MNYFEVNNFVRHKANSKSIHDDVSQAFYKFLGAEDYVINILEKGLIVPGTLPLTSFYAPNNKSALEHLLPFQDKVTEWLDNGYIDEVDERPFFCNPITVAKQEDSSSGKTKFRPCIDLSRSLNLFLNPEATKLDTLESAESLFEPSDFLASFDLRNMYFHVNLHPDVKKYFGFAVPCANGSRYFLFNVMPFGYRLAVQVVTRLCKPIKSFIHDLNIRFTLYIDDGLVMGHSYDETLFKFRTVLHIFELAGWSLNEEKTCKIPATKIKHLGMFVDTVNFIYLCPEMKLQKVCDSISFFLP